MQNFLFADNTGHTGTVRIELDVGYQLMLTGTAVGIELKFDDSPMRTYGLDRVDGCQEILAKSALLVGRQGRETTFAPRACAPCVYIP